MIDLVDSTLCRLCSDDVINGTPIFERYNNEAPLSETINHFLPLQVSDDGKHPRSICPGCHIQLEATSQFFDLLFTGQRRLRELLKEEAERKKREIKEDIKKQLEEVQKQLQEELTTISKADVAFRGILFPSDHHLSLAVEGREFPKRKRGRPRKPKPSEDPIPPVENPPEDVVSSNEENVDPKPETPPKEVEPVNPEPEETGPGRRRRKVPLKFESLVQGKELDKILQEQGVVDAEDLVEEDNVEDQDAELVHSEPEDEEEEEEELDENSETESSTTSKAIPGKRPKLKRKKAKFTCDYCDKAFVTQVRYERHKRTHGEFMAICTHCNVVFDTNEELIVHQTVSGHLHVILEEPNPSSMPDIENLTQECTKNQETPAVGFFTCVKCSISFTEEIAFKNHVSEYHPKNHRYACTVCGREFRMRQALKRHFTVHTGERPYECKECGMSFKSQANLYTHKNVHLGLRRFVCEICGLGLSHTTALKLHMRWHRGEKPHVCVHCDKRFTQKGNLEEHERTHTGERPYVCEFCHRSFATSSQLKLHSKTHTGEKPYKCEHCGKDFLHKSSFEAHIRRHTGVKPFVCSLCPKSFVDPGALKRHIRSHTGEKPYNCNFCGKNFSDKSNLVKHRKGHKDNITNGLPFDSGETNIEADQELSSVIYVTLQEDEATGGAPNEGNPVATNSFNAQFDSINEESTAFSFSADESALVEAASSDFPETDLPLSAALDSLENVDLELRSAASENLCDVPEGQKTIQLTTQDGQTLCWVLPAGVDAVQFANEYLNQLQNESIAPFREES